MVNDYGDVPISIVMNFVVYFV